MLNRLPGPARHPLIINRGVGGLQRPQEPGLRRFARKQSPQAVAVSIPQGRLTVSSGVPVLTSGVAGATSIAYTPYVGRLVPVWNGTMFEMLDIGGDLLQALSDTTKSPAAAVANSNYDKLVWNDGTPRCTRGPAWSSDTARGTGAGTTELERVNGILVNKYDITNGPAARRGTYVGSIRTNASVQVDVTFGSSAAGGGAAVLGIWNMYHRILAAVRVVDSTGNWTYALNTARAANGSTGNRISFLRGMDEDGVVATYATGAYTGTTAFDTARVSIGLDSSTVEAASALLQTRAAAVSDLPTATVKYSGLPGLGWHFLQAVERSTGTSTYIDTHIFSAEIPY